MIENLYNIESDHWSPERGTLERIDDFHALAHHLIREGFRPTMKTYNDPVQMEGFLPTREPFHFGVSLGFKQASLRIGRVGDTPFEKKDPYSSNDDWAVWLKAKDLSGQNFTSFASVEMVEEILRELLDLYHDGSPSITREQLLERYMGFARGLVDKVADVLELRDDDKIEEQ